MTLEGRATAAAFAPGHVTGFFEIHDKDPDPVKRGSRGAGVSTTLGAVSVVEVEPAARQSIEVFLNKEPADAPVTRAAVAAVLQEALRDGRVGLDREAPKGERALCAVRIHADLQLPVSQGFGMSSAGALSAALAAARALRIGRSAAIRAAHVAEVQNRTGLGDVVAATHGGFEIRVAPGLPPYGSVQSLLGVGEVVLCVVGDALATKAVLTDREKRKRIQEHGGRCVDALLAEPSVERLFQLSRVFAVETGLATPAILEAMDAVGDHGHASMAMLGGSVFAWGRTADLVDALRAHGEVFVAGVEPSGARLLEIESAR